jgi:hypothetical protein
MESNLGTRATTTQSWSRDNSWRLCFKEIQDAHPQASERELCKLIAEIVLDDQAVLNALIAYGVRNQLAAQEGYERRAEEVPYVPRPYTKRTPEQRAEQLAEVEAVAKVALNSILQLNQIMPNGKKLRYCTGTEVAGWGNGYAAIGKRAGHKLIGEVMDEQTVRNLLGIK